MQHILWHLINGSLMDVFCFFFSHACKVCISEKVTMKCLCHWFNLNWVSFCVVTWTCAGLSLSLY